MEEIEQLQPILLTHLFNMKATIAGEFRPCEVYRALMADGSLFTRVIMCPLDVKNKQIVDLDHRKGRWVDMYTWEPSIWTDLVSPCLDFQMSFRENLLSLN